jgi:hypothetical protein
MLAGFANAGRWGLAATGGQQPEVWRASWAVGDRNAPERRIWSVHYQGAFVDQVALQRPDLRSAREQLTKALEAAREFAMQQDLDTWPAWFERALTSSDIPYYPDMLPSAYTSEARHLAAMAAQAWVFGGMGSWNDLGFGDRAVEAEYEEVWVDHLAERGCVPSQWRRAVMIQARELNQTPSSLRCAASASRRRPTARAAAAGSSRFSTSLVHAKPRTQSRAAATSGP